MVAPGFLANPEVRRWLNGVEPAWTMLEFDSFNALHDEPSANNNAIRLEPKLTATEVSLSAVAVNAMLLLRRAAETGGLKLTATGNLSRAVIEGMLGIEWPDHDKAELVQYNKVINEPDFLPLHFLRVLMQVAKLLRTHRGKLVPTPLGRRILKAEQDGPLHALLFHVAFWHLNIGYFDGYPLESWPQSKMGIILWSLSASAHDWAVERGTHAALHESGERRPGVAVGFRFRYNGSSHSPTIGLVRSHGIANRRKIAEQVDRSPYVPESAPIRSFSEV